MEEKKSHKRKQRVINLTVESALGLMQEIYFELCEQRNTALAIQKRMMSFMKDVGDLTVIGPIIKDQQKILNDTIERKLALSKLQSTLLQKQEAGNSGGKDKLSNFKLSSEDRELFEKVMSKKEED